MVSVFGLLNEAKGLECMIEAMPTVVATYPDLLYLVLGQTHPEVVKHHGERYCTMVLALCQRLGVEQQVRFVDRFLPHDEVLRYMAATDVYVTPYLAPDQITSGTLAYAQGCGKAMVPRRIATRWRRWQMDGASWPSFAMPRHWPPVSTMCSACQNSGAIGKCTLPPLDNRCPGAR